MTRETKIGLLVGLAFIIVIGILLSDHLSAIEPAPAQLTAVGDSVRSGAAVPPSHQPPITLAAQPVITAPAHPVPTRDELTPQPAPRSVVQISGSNATAQPINITQTSLPQPTPANPAREVATGPAVTETPTRPVPTNLTEVARQNNETLVDVTTGTPVNLRSAATQPTNNVASGKQYAAQANDTVSTMARKFYGANTKTTRDLIINANPSLKASPDKITLGKTYTIPSLPTAAPAAATLAPTAPTRLTIAPTPTPAPIAASYSTYTVKDTDTLWKIASTQLGSASMVNQLKDLNKDVLKGSDVLRVGMVLKLPSKAPVVTASARD